MSEYALPNKPVWEYEVQFFWHLLDQHSRGMGLMFAYAGFLDAVWGLAFAGSSIANNLFGSELRISL